MNVKYEKNSAHVVRLHVGFEVISAEKILWIHFSSDKDISLESSESFVSVREPSLPDRLFSDRTLSTFFAVRLHCLVSNLRKNCSLLIISCFQTLPINLKGL